MPPRIEGRISNNPSEKHPAIMIPQCSFMDEIDLESGGGDHQYHEETLQDQTRRLSELMTTKTELYRLNKRDAEESLPETTTEKEETSGFRYFAREVANAKQHGGDYQQRSTMAFRTALGSFITFAALVFPQQQVLGAVWIGNIFMHSTIKDSFGASLSAVLGFGRSIILTTAISWPVAFFLHSLSTEHAVIVLPFLVPVLTFLIMSCPPLASRNLMILVMYIVVATPVRGEMIWWHPLGWVATYHVGLVVALLMNLFPFSNFALNFTHKQLERLEKDLTMLLMECKAYSDNTATSPSVARASRASIELLQTRTCTTIKTLKAKLPAAKVELEWQCKQVAAKDLSDWITHCEKLLTPLRMLRNALAQRLLGEEYAIYSPHLREAKIIINEEIGPSRDRLVDAMIAAIAVCHAWADPSCHRTVLPDVQSELRYALKECRQAFHRATLKAAQRLGRNKNPQSTSPIFAHLTRRMSSFNALFALGDSLLLYLERHSWENEDMDETVIHRGPINYVVSMFYAFIKLWQPKWLWNKPDTYRLALKTSIGMSIASLFISVPYLYNISQPFSVWPGLTIASVNLISTGSSFRKAADRLFGTLIAAAFALLVSDLFPGNRDFVKIPAISIFTYLVIYLRNKDHSYTYTYAATSIGSMLYGSVKNDFNISGYIPKRIELIFVGVVIFSIVELLLFPRSSRRIVEETSYQFFFSMKEFLNQATICTKHMETYVYELGKITTKEEESSLHSSTSSSSSTITTTPSNDNTTNTNTNTNNNNYARCLFNESDDPFHLQKLTKCHKQLQMESNKLKKELESSFEEPYAGLSMPLQTEYFRCLVHEQSNSEIQAILLLDSLKKLALYYQKEQDNNTTNNNNYCTHVNNTNNWSQLHTAILKDCSDTMNNICNCIQIAYPDKRLRPQNNNSLKAVTAAASFRTLEDVRLRSISLWSNNFNQLFFIVPSSSDDPIAIMTLGITTACILELCRHMQKAGKHTEEITYRFPPTD